MREAGGDIGYRIIPPFPCRTGTFTMSGEVWDKVSPQPQECEELARASGVQGV